MPQSQEPKPPGESASCFNAVKHGCCSARFSAKSPVLPGEDESAWQEVLKDWFDEYQPDTPVSRALVTDLALAFWQKARNHHQFQQFQQSLAGKQAMNWTDGDHGNYSRFQRYKTTADRAFSRAFKDLEYFRKVRLSEQEALRCAEERFEKLVGAFSRDLLKMEVEYARLNSQMEMHHREMQANGLRSKSDVFTPASRESLDRLARSLDRLLDGSLLDSEEHFAPDAAPTDNETES